MGPDPDFGPRDLENLQTPKFGLSAELKQTRYNSPIFGPTLGTPTPPKSRKMGPDPDFGPRHLENADSKIRFERRFKAN